MSKKSNFLPVGLNKSSTSTYTSAVNAYTKFHQLNMDELINEALTEQENMVPEHQLKIYDRILSFREYNTEKLLGNTVIAYETIIKQIYSNARVKIPTLPRINTKILRKNEALEFEDYLTKDELKRAMQYLSLPLQARFIGMVSSGSSNKEMDSFTTRQFIDDMYCYHQCDDDREALKYLANKNHHHIWCAKLIREKTQKPYYACFSPEAVQLIALVKYSEKKLKPKLYINDRSYFKDRLALINDKYGFGYAGGHRRLRPHMLRHFHATYISMSVLDYGEEAGLRNFEVDELQGRGKTKSQDTYIKTTRIRQKMLYAKVLNNISLFHEYEYEFRDGDVHIWLKDHRKKYDKLVRENQKMKSALENNNSVSDELKKYIEVVGYDNFKEGLSELLSQL